MIRLIGKLCGRCGGGTRSVPGLKEEPDARELKATGRDISPPPKLCMDNKVEEFKTKETKEIAEREESIGE